MKTLKKNPLVQRMEDMNILGSAIWFGVNQNEKPIKGTVLYHKFLRKEKTPVIRGKIKTHHKDGKFKQKCKHKSFTFWRFIYGRKDARGNFMTMFRQCKFCGQMQNAHLRYVDCTSSYAAKMGHQDNHLKLASVVAGGEAGSEVINYRLI